MAVGQRFFIVSSVLCPKGEGGRGVQRQTLVLISYIVFPTSYFVWLLKGGGGGGAEADFCQRLEILSMSFAFANAAKGGGGGSGRARLSTPNFDKVVVFPRPAQLTGRHHNNVKKQNVQLNMITLYIKTDDISQKKKRKRNNKSKIK